VPDLRPRLTLGRAHSILAPFLEAARTAPFVEALAAAGSVRRVEPTVGDLLLVTATTRPAAVFDHLSALPPVVDARRSGPSELLLRVGPEEVRIRAIPPPRYGAALVCGTGSRAHVAALEDRARRLGLELSPDGLGPAGGGAPLPTPGEEDVYSALQLAFVPPELRQGEGEIDAADSGTLPLLVTIDDLRGDLHMHTNWSDGRDPIETMVRGCLALGYEYMAITDHSPSCGASRVLSEETLERQAEAIAEVRPRYPGLTILHGVEVDILPDGRLDFTDALLGRLDIVLASLHDAAGQSRKALLDRYAAAMRHPLVNIITHPTNRLVGRREGYELDTPRLFAAAVETGTALEIDGAPSHLDMDGEMARAAIEAGVIVSIDSDCHDAALLRRQRDLGVGTARRGWVEARHVLNARPLAEVRAFVERKRSAG
jgi:DNA polymerase (family X)